jgi:triosephosphate isomerase (TIM)
MRLPLIAGNWKMHGDQNFAEKLLDALSAGAHNIAAEVAVMPPFVHLSLAANVLDGAQISYGAQDVSAHDEGAHTGEISSSMLLDIGCKYVIVGHSERRQHCFETSTLVADKFAAAAKAGLRPILCIGENLAERESEQTEAVLAEQLAPVLALPVEYWQEAVVAYEPVWAIGTGLSASPEMAQSAHSFIRSLVAEKFGEKLAKSLRILYGGSVKPVNAADLFAMPDIDGALVGGAALTAESFLKIGELCKI